MKGTGKGVLGLVLRPTGGLIDLTSATLTAVQRLVCSFSFLGILVEY